jgi:hypothetical protein
MNHNEIISLDLFRVLFKHQQTKSLLIQTLEKTMRQNVAFVSNDCEIFIVLREYTQTRWMWM